MSGFPAGKGSATPLFPAGLLSAHGRGKACPDQQTRDRNKPPRFLPVAEVSSPAQALFFFFPSFFFLMKTPSKPSFFYRKKKKKQPGVAFTELLPAPEEHGGAVVPTVALGTVTALFWGDLPILKVFWWFCSPECWREGSAEGSDI